MDFDTAKENILPLRSGRRADLMESALGSEKEILEQEKKRFEEEINTYEGKDPLDPWYRYICWIEQSYFKSGNDGGLLEVIRKCIKKFEDERKYRQDRRLIKLFIKYIDTRDNQRELYQQLYDNGFGTLVADLYIAWSYYFDVANDFKNAEAVFQRGFDAGAQPYDELAQAHQAFSVSVSKRVLCNDESAQRHFQETMDEKRHALTRLNARKNKYVGSLRTGIAVKFENPGRVVLDENQGVSNAGGSSGHQRFAVHQDSEPESALSSAQSLIGKSILETAKVNENVHEPGPWNKAKINAGKGVFSRSTVPTRSNFNILEDEVGSEPIPCRNKLYEKGCSLPLDFVARNKPQTPWHVPIIIEEPETADSIPRYDKFSVYPKGARFEISLEEIRGFNWFKARHMASPLIDEYDSVLSNKFENGARIFPGYMAKNLPQRDVKFELTKALSDKSKPAFSLDQMVTESGEVSIEELLAKKFYRGEIKLAIADDFEEIDENDDMEITVIGDRRQSVYPIARKSIVPRKSILRKSVYQPAIYEDDCAKSDVRQRVRFEEPLREHQQREENGERKAEMEKKEEEEEENDADGSSGSITKKRKLNASDDVHEAEAPENKAISDDDGEETLKAPPQQFSPAESAPKSTSSSSGIEKRNSVERKSPKTDVKSPPFELFKQPPPVERKTIRPLEMTDDDPNDTCSTVQFNFFIQQQSVSTPIAKKTVPRLVPLSNAENAAVTQPASSGFTIYTDEPAIDDVVAATNKNELHDNENLHAESSSVCTSIMQPNIVPKQLSTIMEVTETTHSTKSSVSSVNDATKSTPAETEKPMYNLSVFRIPEDQTETVPYNLLKFAQPPKTPGRFLELDEFQNSIKPPQSSAHQQQQSFLTIPNLDFSMPADVSMTEKKEQIDVLSTSLSRIEVNEDHAGVQVPQIEIPATQDIAHEEEKEISHVEIPATQDAHEDEPSMLEIPQIQYSMHIPATQDFMANEKEESSVGVPTLLQDEKDREISHLEIPATQIEMSHAEIPPTQDPVSSQEPPAKETCMFTIYEDTESTALPVVRLQQLQQAPKLDESNNFHMSRKENYPVLPNDSSSKRKISDEFLSLCGRSPAPDTKAVNCSEREISDLLKFSDLKANKTLEGSFRELAIEQPIKSASPTMNIFEDDLNTQKFSMHLTLDKNSTILGSTFAKPLPVANKIDTRPSLDISIEYEEEESVRLYESAKQTEAVFKVPEIPLPPPTKPEVPKFEIFVDPSEGEEEEQNDDLSRSIYYNNGEKKPSDEEFEDGLESWEDEKMCSFIADPNNCYEHTMHEMNLSSKLREAIIQSNGNPFCENVRSKILDMCNFEKYLDEHVETCTMLKNIPKLKSGVYFESGLEKFKVLKFIAKGSFGSVYAVQNTRTGEAFAAKQEKPANTYEYYICIELLDRLREKSIDHMLPAFMQIHQAVVANNASVFVTELSPHGTIIDVCNKIKLATGRNVDEYVGMVLTAQLLSIIDFLHSCSIIHADIKPDNFLVMSKIEIGMKVPALQLIDFGSAIDMLSYAKDDTFDYVVKTENFTCCEMREKRPWTFQTDFFGVCGTAHVILFGKYMDVEKKLGNWQITSRFPRYFQKATWDEFFNTLLNVPDCFTMPNLQHLKQNFDREVLAREKYVSEKITLFNNALMS